MPFIRQEATLWKPFNNKMTLLYSFPKVGLWGIPPLDESSRNPTKILRCLKTSTASTCTQRSHLFSCLPQYLGHRDYRLENLHVVL